MSERQPTTTATADAVSLFGVPLGAKTSGGVEHVTTFDASASISTCGRYRYALERRILGSTSPMNLCWLMLNPSTADATKDDPTIRKVKGFTSRAGYGVAMVVNLFAWRATKPKDVVVNLADAEGDANCAAIMQAAQHSDAVVCAWGSEKGRPWVTEQRKRVLSWLLDHPDRKVFFVCLGTNDDGSPRHPLMVPYAQPLVSFDATARAG